MGIDVTVQPISMDWAGLDTASLNVLVDVSNYDAPGQEANRTEARAAINWDMRPEYAEELTEEQIAASLAAVKRLQRGLAERIGAPVSWEESLPAPLDLETATQLGPDLETATQLGPATLVYSDPGAEADRSGRCSIRTH